MAKRETGVDWDKGEIQKIATPPSTGLKFFPDTISLTEEKTKGIWLIVNTEICKAGEMITIEDDKDQLFIDPEEVIIPDDCEHAHPIKIRLRSNDPGIDGIIEAQCKGVKCEALYEVKEEVYQTPQGAMDFIPSETNVIDTKQGSLYLYVDTSLIPINSKLDVISFAPEIVEIIDDKIVIQEEFVRNDIARLRIRIRAYGIGRQAMIRAAYDSYSAEALIRVTSESEPAPPSTPSGGSGLFKEIRYDSTLKTLERGRYDEESGIIWIHTKEPVVERYLQESASDQDLLHAQIIEADIVARLVCEAIRHKQIETGDKPYYRDDEAGRMREDVAVINSLLHEYGPKIHQILVDGALLNEARKLKDVESEMIQN